MSVCFRLRVRCGVDRPRLPCRTDTSEFKPLLSVRFQPKKNKTKNQHVPQLRRTFTVFLPSLFSRGNKTASRSSHILAACEAAPGCCLSQIGFVLFCKPPFSAKGQLLKSKLWLPRCSPTPSWSPKAHIFFLLFISEPCVCFLVTDDQKAKENCFQKLLSLNL